jgi:hypothetical protein
MMREDNKLIIRLDEKKSRSIHMEIFTQSKKFLPVAHQDPHSPSVPHAMINRYLQ